MNTPEKNNNSFPSNEHWLSPEFIRESSNVMRIGVRKIQGKASGPIVTGYGSARIPRDDKFYVLGNKLGKRLVESGLSVLTGGGPGFMQALNEGARSAAVKGNFSLALQSGLLKSSNGEHTPNNIYDVRLVSETSLFARRHLLISLASAGHIVGPGGYGTLDEIGEILMLLQNRVVNTVPLIFLEDNERVFTDLLSWVRKHMLRVISDDSNQQVLVDRYISVKDLGLFENIININEHNLDESVEKILEIVTAFRSQYACIDKKLPDASAG